MIGRPMKQLYVWVLCYNNFKALGRSLNLPGSPVFSYVNRTGWSFKWIPTPKLFFSMVHLKNSSCNQLIPSTFLILCNITLKTNGQSITPPVSDFFFIIWAKNGLIPQAIPYVSAFLYGHNANILEAEISVKYNMIDSILNC